MLSQTNPETLPKAYEFKMLQLKSEYLLGMPVNKTLMDLQLIVSKDGFQTHHKNALNEIIEILSVK